MKTLINIDNGGTLTDICVWNEDSGFTFAKTLTTPQDLSQCLFDGISKASTAVYGEENTERLLHETAHIRYSTTQGTNALVERRGPDIGILSTVKNLQIEMTATEAEQILFNDLIADRILYLDSDDEHADIEYKVVQQVNKLTTMGAARIVIVGESRGQENELRSVLLQKFPRHLLGSVPLIYSWSLVGDRDTPRRVWSCVVNSYLHPTMERFLYAAERRLKPYKVTNPLLVYRNDGASSRVAKAVALKTYSSGPRGGLEGTAAIARKEGIEHAIMMDIGGTTTDVGLVDNGNVDVNKRGSVKGAPVSIQMSNVHSKGVGGSSIIKVVDGKLQVGPESVGAAPGPACFGFGGTDATLTDANLLLGILDSDTYLDGTFKLDADRSRAVITKNIAEPLNISLEEALVRMADAHSEALATTFSEHVKDNSTLVAFGGAGPMSAAGAARRAGVKQVLIPRMAAVFSAAGISFSDIGKTYESGAHEPTSESVQDTYDRMLARAERDMFQEGYALADCELTWTLTVEHNDGSPVTTKPYTRGDAVSHPGEQVSLLVSAMAELPHPELPKPSEVAATPAPANGSRSVRSSSTQVDDVPVYILDDLEPGHSGEGPAIIEGPFFTARVLEGWNFRIASSNNIYLTDTNA